MFLVSDEKQQELGETKWRKEVQLYNKHGYNLGIFPGGFVRWVPGARCQVPGARCQSLDNICLRSRPVDPDVVCS